MGYGGAADRRPGREAWRMFRRRRDPAAVRAGVRNGRYTRSGRAGGLRPDALVLDGVSREYRPGAVALHPSI
ncbi:hypothetical protein NKH77_25545 [Streptomyces sp. M19]